MPVPAIPAALKGASGIAKLLGLLGLWEGSGLAADYARAKWIPSLEKAQLAALKKERTSKRAAAAMLERQEKQQMSAVADALEQARSRGQARDLLGMESELQQGFLDELSRFAEGSRNRMMETRINGSLAQLLSLTGQQ